MEAKDKAKELMYRFYYSEIIDIIERRKIKTSKYKYWNEVKSEIIK